MVHFWEVCLGKYGSPTPRTILLKVLPTKALQRVINRHKTFAMALLSLQKLPCMRTKFQWSRLHLLIHPFPVKWQVGKQSWEPLKPPTTGNELPFVSGVSLTGPMFLNPLSLSWRIQFFVYRGTAKHVCACMRPSVFFNTTNVVMKKDPNGCISLCSGKKIL